MIRAEGDPDLPPEDLPDGPMAWMSGPEHLQEADMLLSGYRRWPHRISDRIAAAAVHIAAANVQLQAMSILHDFVDENQARALRAQWLGVLRMPPDIDGIDELVCQWSADERPEAEPRPGPGDEQGSDA